MKLIKILSVYVESLHPSATANHRWALLHCRHDQLTDYFPHRNTCLVILCEWWYTVWGQIGKINQPFLTIACRIIHYSSCYQRLSISHWFKKSDFTVFRLWYLIWEVWFLALLFSPIAWKCPNIQWNLYLNTLFKLQKLWFKPQFKKVF